MMLTTYPYARGAAGLILLHLSLKGEIDSLDRFANLYGLTPCWVWREAHRLEREGMVVLERQTTRRGKPYLCKPGPKWEPIAEETL